MKKYNYYYDSQPITKQHFLKAVPENWQSEIENGTYSYGYYRAIEIEA